MIFEEGFFRDQTALLSYPFSQVTMSGVLSSVVPLAMRSKDSEYERQRETRSGRWREKNKSQ